MEKVEPIEGQTWAHRTYGMEMNVSLVSGSKVVLSSEDGQRRIGMLKEQLWDIYEPVSA